MDRIAHQDLHLQFSFVSIIDHCIDAVLSDLQTCVREAPTTTIARAVTALFALRNCFLHLVLYNDLAASRKKSLRAVKVVVCTKQGRLKLKGKLSHWPRLLGQRTHEIMLMDEMESVGNMQAAACLVGAHGAILSGDENQDPGRNSMTRQTGASSLIAFQQKQHQLPAPLRM